MKIKLQDATPLQLDALVAQSEGYSLTTDGISRLVEKGMALVILGPCTTGSGHQCGYSPTTRWEQGGPLIAQALMVLSPDPQVGWTARSYMDAVAHSGPTPLIAAMRCYAGSVFGEEVDVPEGLTP